MKFWDASAIVPLILEEDKRDRLLAMLEADGALIVWWRTPVECASAIARLERDGALGSAAANAAFERLRALEPSWVEINPSLELRRIAQRLLRTHALRAADSLQLAAALVAAEHDPASLDFVCLDARLALAASREGFSVVTP